MCGGRLVALIIRRSLEPSCTTFLTPNDFNLQVGFVVYGADTRIPRHAHLPLQRTIVGTNEVVIVRRGSCTAEIFDEARQLIAEYLLQEGDIIVLNGGAHGFRVHQDTVLLEVKQGPYSDAPEKERF